MFKRLPSSLLFITLHSAKSKAFTGNIKVFLDFGHPRWGFLLSRGGCQGVSYAPLLRSSGPTRGGVRTAALATPSRPGFSKQAPMASPAPVRGPSTGPTSTGCRPNEKTGKVSLQQPPGQPKPTLLSTKQREDPS